MLFAWAVCQCICSFIIGNLRRKIGFLRNRIKLMDCSCLPTTAIAMMFSGEPQVPKLKIRGYATACVYRELYGKITDRKKNCAKNYQMCRELVSCADFKAILTPFSEVI